LPAYADKGIMSSRGVGVPTSRLRPCLPIFVFEFARELFALRHWDLQFAPLFQLPPASRALGKDTIPPQKTPVGA
jgi:hypothetical protein